MTIHCLVGDCTDSASCPCRCEECYFAREQALESLKPAPPKRGDSTVVRCNWCFSVWCVPVDPRWTSQTCSACGTVVKKQLRQREHRCGCGFVAHRDHNAALNVLARGLRAGQLTEAPGGAGPMFSTLSKPDGVSS
jgi:hypothetical protein